MLGIFVDFSKAFNTINYEILIDKLKTVAFDDKAITWLKSYLSDRSQSAWMKDILSEANNIVCGVPQGSVLGPTLFFDLY